MTVVYCVRNSAVILLVMLEYGREIICWKELI